MAISKLIGDRNFIAIARFAKDTAQVQHFMFVIVNLPILTLYNENSPYPIANNRDNIYSSPLSNQFGRPAWIRTKDNVHIRHGLYY